MSSLQAIIFDMDGTLADTEEVHRRAFNAAFVEFGYDWQWSVDEYIELLLISGGRERIRHYLQLKEDLDHDETLKMAQLIHTRKSEIYREKLSDDRITLRPGVKRLINEARQEGIKLAIATSSSKKNVATLLHNTLGDDALDWFGTIITCEVIEAQKPSPVVYEMALAGLNVDPRHCVAIEDTRNGNLSALAAGLKTIITTHALTIDDDFHGASLILDQLGEPDAPFTVTSGEVNNASYVTTQLLSAIVSGMNSKLEVVKG